MKLLKEQLSESIKGIANQAYTDFIGNYWDGSIGSEYFVDPYKENRTSLSDLPWIYVMGILSMETYYLETGDESFVQYLQGQWTAWKNNRGKDWMLATGEKANPAVDDAAWTAMGLMLVYKYLGDDKALDWCHELIGNAYDYWQDGSTANGLWYSYPQDNNGHVQVKTVYCAGLILTELEYYEITKDDPARCDESLHQRTLDLYNWIEENLRREEGKVWNGEPYPHVDHLYFCSFVDNKETGEYHPDRYEKTDEIRQARSWSSLFGNTGMCVINKRLYDMTGDTAYLDKAVATANALVTTAYNNNGILLNDRDAWTNCAFLGDFVREVLPLEGIDPQVGLLILRTTPAILKNCTYEGGFYGSDWDGSGAWTQKDTKGEHTAWFAANATTTHMFYVSLALANRGLIPLSEEDVSLMGQRWPLRKIDEIGNVISCG